MSMLEINSSFERYELATLLGGRKSLGFSCSVEMKIDKLGVRLKELMKPRLYYRTRKIDSIKKQSVHLLGGAAFTSPKLSRSMKNCDEIICFVATIGHGVEKEIVRLMDQNHLSDAYILDSMGSVTAENMVETFYQRMRTKYRAEGKGVTLRFSPGYCDWPVTDQKQLFSSFDSVQIAVELMDSCLMLPRKSISGVFGLFPFNPNLSVSSYNPCSECEKRDCLWRRK